MLVGYDGHVKLADFGVAKALDINATRGTTIKGKYGYLSPEQVRCQPLDQRSDIFALGIVLWEMTTGRALFKRENEVANGLRAHRGARSRRRRSAIPDYPRDLENIVMKALARPREERYASALEMANELPPASPTTTAGTSRRLRCRRCVRDTVPDDQVAFGRIGGSDAFSSGLGKAGPTTTTRRRVGRCRLARTGRSEIEAPVRWRPGRTATSSSTRS